MVGTGANHAGGVSYDGSASSGTHSAEQCLTSTDGKSKHRVSSMETIHLLTYLFILCLFIHLFISRWGKSVQHILLLNKFFIFFIFLLCWFVYYIYLFI